MQPGTKILDESPLGGPIDGERQEGPRQATGPAR